MAAIPIPVNTKPPSHTETPLHAEENLPPPPRPPPVNPGVSNPSSTFNFHISQKLND